MPWREKDIFAEHLVKRVATPDILLFRIFLVLLAVAGTVAVVWGLGVSLLSLLILVVTWTVLRTAFMSTIVEYEYILTNGIFDIDKITAKSKRSRLISIDLAQVQDFGQYPPTAHTAAYQNQIRACSYPKADTLWYCAVPTERGQALVVFNMTPELLDAMTSYLPKHLRP